MGDHRKTSATDLFIDLFSGAQILSNFQRSRELILREIALLYPKLPLARAMERDPAVAVKALAFLNGIDSALLVGEGRVYGGGLYKKEPRAGFVCFLCCIL
jgi:hypothetical protein